MKYRGTKKMKNKENPGIEKMRKTMGIHNRGMENLGVWNTAIETQEKKC
jgi:hypothetical protein